MKFDVHLWTLMSPLILGITPSQGKYVCNDTNMWENIHGFPCYSYEFGVSDQWWCPNGTYTARTWWTGGSFYRYPEFNCCACGKGWPLWFVPADGTTATKAIPEQTTGVTNKLICSDAYRNLTTCTMKCKTLPVTQTITSIKTLSTEDYSQLNCTLNLNMNNNSFQYILQIPIDNYLIYFTNWTTSDYNFSCINSTGVISPQMLCRYEVEPYLFQSFQCLSENITNRYIHPDCVDTDNWNDSARITCFEYEIIYLYCANGKFTNPASIYGGPLYNYPERNCCACGKGLLYPFQSTSPSTTDSSVNMTEIGIIHLQNCYTTSSPTYIFDLKCLGPLNFSTTDTMMNTTLYNCPLNCFFDWNTTQIQKNQNVTISSYLLGSSFWYYLKSYVFPNSQIFCGPIAGQNGISTYSAPMETTFTHVTNTETTTVSHIPNTSQPPTTDLDKASTYSSSLVTKLEQTSTLDSTTISHDPNTSPSSTNFLTTANPSIAWQPPTCPNGQIGLNCDVSVDPCLMTQPCLNNGTCIITNSISYICLCPPLKFTGRYCEIDIRPCQRQTCLSRGTCIETNSTSFICQCESGYEGIHCESLTNYCNNITCQNNAPCQPSRLNFTCECLTKDFSGRYCELKSSSLTTKQTVNRSFGYIAILAMGCVAGFIIILDVLKYVFHIDPVETERKRLRDKRRLTQSKAHKPTVIRYIYVNAPKVDAIAEENEV